MGVSQNLGSLLGGPYNKDYSLSGFKRPVDLGLSRVVKVVETLQN